MPVRLPLVPFLLALLGADVPPPASGRTVALALCPDVERCADDLAWLRGRRELAGDGLWVADAVLELNSGTVDDGVPLEERFQGALERARAAVAQGRPAAAAAALEDAEDALDRWAGVPANQALFEVSFLRGVVRLRQGDVHGQRASFQQAAAVAWNREVQPPVRDEDVLDAWYAAQGALLEAGTGLLRLESPLPGARAALDGVALGAPPLEVRLFPGRHRVVAWEGSTGIPWVLDVVVHPGEVLGLEARFDRTGDLAWVYERLEEALSTRRMDPAVAALLARWCAREGITRLRLVRAAALWPEALDGPAPGGETGPGAPAAPQPEGGYTGERRYRLEQALYDPRLRSFRDGD